MNEEKKDETKTKDEVKTHEPNVFKRTARTYMAEFRKIVWPSKETMMRHTLTVVVVSLIFGAYIALADFIFAQGYSLFLNLIS